jgi:hypothetical protein
MSVAKVLESMDRSGDGARRAADEEAAVRAALRAEVARAGSQRALGVEWNISAQYLGMVLGGRSRPSAKVRARLGFGARPARKRDDKLEQRRSSKLDGLHVGPAPKPAPARPERDWAYPLRPFVLNIFATEKGLRRWASESAPGQIREREAAMSGEPSNGN